MFLLFLIIFTAVLGAGILIAIAGFFIGRAMETDFGNFIVRASIFNLIASAILIVFNLFKIL